MRMYAGFEQPLATAGEEVNYLLLLTVDHDLSELVVDIFPKPLFSFCVS